jgi:hypothetical protein
LEFKIQTPTREIDMKLRIDSILFFVTYTVPAALAVLLTLGPSNMSPNISS